MAEPARKLEPENKKPARAKARLQAVPSNPKELELFLKTRNQTSLNANADIENEVETGTETTVPAQTNNVVTFTRPEQRTRDDIRPTSTRDDVEDAPNRDDIENKPTREDIGESADNKPRDDIDAPDTGADQNKSRDDLEEDSESQDNDNPDKPSPARPEKPVYGSDAAQPSDPKTGKPEDKVKKEKTRDDLSDDEENADNTASKANTAEQEERSALGLQEAEDQSFYKKNIAKKAKLRFGIFRRRRTILGGGIVGTIIGLITFFSLSAGPLQFIHISQLLQQWHFSTQQDQQDNRFMHALRWARYANNQESQKARMGVLGNSMTDKYEARVKKIGLIPRYSTTFGRPIGFEVDTESKDSPYHGMSADEARAAASRDLGLDVVSYDGKLDASLTKKPMIEIPSGYAKSLSFNRQILRKASVGAVSSVVGTKLFANRSGASMHPLSILVSKLQDTAEANIQKTKAEKQADITQEVQQREANLINKGERINYNQKITVDLTGKTKEQTATANSNVEAAKSAVSSVQAEGDKAKSSLMKGDFLSFKTFKSGFIKGGLGVGVFCTLRGLDSNINFLKQAQVILPLERMGFNAISTGAQIQSGNSVDVDALKVLNDQLNGVDANGNKTSWWDAASVQAELGKTGGVAPNDTLTSITQGSPFKDFGETGKYNGVLSKVCEGLGGGILTIIGFIGGPLDLAANLIQGVALSKLMSTAADWLAGAAVNPLVTGADYGNYINYGARLASNDMAMVTGGTKLTPVATNELANIENAQWQKEYKSKSIAYKLFNTSDSRTAISKIIDRSSPSPTENIAKMGGFFMNIGKSVSSIGSIFSSKASAATGSYDYSGIPKFGFSAEELSLPEFDNPYKNAGVVSDLLDKEKTSGTTTYQDFAVRCFGIKLFPDSEGKWDATTNGEQSPKYYEKKDGCSGSTDQTNVDEFNKLRLRFFIMDTVTINGMSCYEGDNQACSDVGYSGASSASTTQDTTIPASDSSVLNNDSSNTSCDPRTIDLGGTYEGWQNEQSVNITLCEVPNLPSSGEESNSGWGIPNAHGHAVVNARVSGQVYEMTEAFNKAHTSSGLKLGAISSFRTMSHQQALCNDNALCKSGTYTRVAKPGTSNHQMGLAIDFANLPSSAGPIPGNPYWEWLSSNASTYSYKNYPAEAWHWSPTGN